MPEKLQFPDLEQFGPGSPAGQYLRRFWQPVARASELAPGRAKPVELLGEKFTGKILKLAESEDSLEGRVGMYGCLGCSAPGHNLVAAVPTS